MHQSTDYNHLCLDEICVRNSYFRSDYCCYCKDMVLKFHAKIIMMKLTCCYCCHYCHSSSAKKRQDLVCWGNWGITYLVCMIYEIIGELTRLLLTLTIVFTMMRMKERKDEMEKHLWPNSLNSDNVTSSTADSILIQAYCKKENGTLPSLLTMF